MPQGGALIAAESLENLVLDLLLRACRALERLPAGGRDVDTVAPAVVGITATDEVPRVLEVVEQQHDVVGVHAQRLHELVLRRAIVVAEVTQRHEQAEIHAEQVRTAAPDDLLGQPRQQRHRARRMG